MKAEGAHRSSVVVTDQFGVIAGDVEGWPLIPPSAQYRSAHFLRIADSSYATGMPGLKQESLDPKKLQGFEYFRLIDDLPIRRHDHKTQCDKARNGELFCNQCATLFLLYFFNPTVTSLKGLQQFTTLEKVQKLCGVKPTYSGSLSEAARGFDPCRSIRMANRLTMAQIEPAFGNAELPAGSGRRGIRRHF